LLADRAPAALTANKPAWLESYHWLEPQPIFCPHCHGPLVQRPLAVLNNLPAGANANNQPVTEELQQSVGVINSS